MHIGSVSGHLAEFGAALRQDGYSVIREAVSLADVECARDICDQCLQPDPDAETEIEATKVLQSPDLVKIIFNEDIIGVLTALLGGSLAYYPNYVVRLNRVTSWHVDNGFVPKFQEKADHLYDPEFRHLQCVIYFQENVVGVGGGLDVRPGSHGWARDGGVPDYEALKAQYPEVASVDSRAGDLVIFDGRLMHRGTPISGTLRRRKYGIFWSASRDDATQVQRYADYLGARGAHLRASNPSANYEYMLRRYDDVHAVRFPGSYLPQTAELVRCHRILLPETGP